MQGDGDLPVGLDDLCALERAVDKEWWWLSGALHAVAEIRADFPHAPAGRFRELQAQKLTLDRKRVEIAVRIAAIMGPRKNL
jgi:hypothetical protein